MAAGLDLAACFGVLEHLQPALDVTLLVSHPEVLSLGEEQPLHAQGKSGRSTTERLPSATDDSVSAQRATSLAFLECGSGSGFRVSRAQDGHVTPSKPPTGGLLGVAVSF